MKIPLTFIGDLIPHLGVLENSDFNICYEEVRDRFSGRFVCANLETPIGEGFSGKGFPGMNGVTNRKRKDIRFSAPKGFIDAAVDAGIDLFSLSNNHILDMGEEGVRRTLEYMDETGYEYIGVYTDKYIPYIKEINGVKIAFMSMTCVSKKTLDRPKYNISVYSRTKAENRMKKCKKIADIVVVIMHFGVEDRKEPSQNQKLICRFLKSMGADIIIGSHPHMVQRVECDGKTLVAYSLGNFLCGKSRLIPTRNIGCILDVDIEYDGRINNIEYRITKTVSDGKIHIQ